MDHNCSTFVSSDWGNVGCSVFDITFLLGQVAGVDKCSAGAAALVSTPSSRGHGTVIPTKSLNNLAQSLQVRSEWSVNNGVFME